MRILRDMMITTGQGGKIADQSIIDFNKPDEPGAVFEKGRPAPRNRVQSLC